MLLAREMGFNVALVYVGTSSVEINIARIARRVIGVVIMCPMPMSADALNEV